MTDRIKVEFELMDPNLDNAEAIRRIQKVLYALGITHPRIWIWVPPDKNSKPTKKERERRERIAERLKKKKLDLQ